MQSEQRKELPRSQRECRILGASMREAHAMASGLLELVLSSLSAKEIEIDDLRSSECGSRGDSLGHSTQPNHGWLLRPVPRLLPAKHGAWLKQRRQDVPPTQWGFVDVWKLRQGMPFKTNLSAASLRCALAHQQNGYRQALPKLEEFARAFHAGKANLRVIFQVWEGPEMGEQAERRSQKLQRTARCFDTSPTNWRTG
jgi:hypothetical protein